MINLEVWAEDICYMEEDDLYDENREFYYVRLQLKKINKSLRWEVINYRDKVRCNHINPFSDLPNLKRVFDSNDLSFNTYPFREEDLKLIEY